MQDRQDIDSEVIKKSNKLHRKQNIAVDESQMDSDRYLQKLSRAGAKHSKTHSDFYFNFNQKKEVTADQSKVHAKVARRILGNPKNTSELIFSPGKYRESKNSLRLLD